MANQKIPELSIQSELLAAPIVGREEAKDEIPVPDVDSANDNPVGEVKNVLKVDIGLEREVIDQLSPNPIDIVEGSKDV